MTIGWLVAENVVMAAALAAGATAICRLRRVGPVARHALWLVVLIKLVTPPLVVLESPWSWPWPAAPAPVELSVTTPASIAESVVAPFGGDTLEAPALLERLREDNAATSATTRTTAARAVVTPPPFKFWQLATIIWSIGTLFFVAVQTARVVRMARKVLAGMPPTSDLARIVGRISESMGINAPSIAVVSGLASPVVWCVNPMRPLLLWPSEIPFELSPACRAGLITHELAHVKRRDHWVGWLELVAGAAWWWNPLFWFVRARLRENAELACDAWVIDSMPDGRRAYAEALLAACTIGPSRLAPMPAVGVSTGNRRFLERRLAMIMQDRVPVRLSRVAVVSLFLIAMATLPVWASRVAPAGADPAQAQAKPITVAPTTGTGPVTIVTSDGPVQATSVQIESSPKIDAFLFADDGQLPDDASKLIKQYQTDQENARKEMDAKLAGQRDELMKKLQALQDSYTKAGKLDEAVAIRNRIRQLQTSNFLSGWQRHDGTVFSGAPFKALTRSVKTTPFAFAKDANSLFYSHADAVDPIQRAITALRGQSGASLVVEVEGSDSKDGGIWGSDVYTDDSSVAVAAVHAGLLKPGEKGLIRVILMPGQDSYKGAERHGVTSEDFRRFAGSYRLEKVSGR